MILFFLLSYKAYLAKGINLLNIILAFFSFPFYTSLIVIPFKKESKEIKFIEKNDTYYSNVMESLEQNIIYSTLYFGEPKRPTNLLLSSSYSGFHLITKDCNFGDEPDDSFYNYYSSSSSKVLFDMKMSYLGINAFFAIDKLYLYTDFTQKNIVEYKEFPFMYACNDKNKSVCGSLGLDLSDPDEENTFIFVERLKSESLIDSCVWTIKFNKNSGDGVLIIGEEPHEYDNKTYDIDNLRSTNTVPTPRSIKFDWSLRFDSVYFIYKNNSDNKNEKKDENNNYKIEISNDEEIFQLNYEMNSILGIEDYRIKIETYFFNDLISQNKCYLKEIQTRNKMFICIEGKITKEDLMKFPPLRMVSTQIGYEFVLTYEDLFSKPINGEIFFLVFFKNPVFKKWNMGKIFLEKYQFHFDLDSKLISFYLPKENGKKENLHKEHFYKSTIFIILIIVILFICLMALGILLGRKIYMKSIRKRKNELNDDDYDYLPDSTEKNKQKKNKIFGNFEFESNDDKNIN